MFIPIRKDCRLSASAPFADEATQLWDLDKHDVVRQAKRIELDPLGVIAIQRGALDAKARHAKALAVGDGRKRADVAAVCHRITRTLTMPPRRPKVRRRWPPRLSTKQFGARRLGSPSRSARSRFECSRRQSVLQGAPPPGATSPAAPRRARSHRTPVKRPPRSARRTAPSRPSPESLIPP